MAKKTFGMDGLNALDNAVEVVSEAMEVPAVENTAASPSPQEPVTQQAEATAQSVIATKPEAKSRVVSAPVPAAAVPAKQSAKPKKKSQEEITEDSIQEPTKPLNVHLPLSVYKRLYNLKLDSDNEPLKSFGLKAIIEFLERNGY